MKKLKETPAYHSAMCLLRFTAALSPLVVIGLLPITLLTLLVPNINETLYIALGELFFFIGLFVSFAIILSTQGINFILG